MVKKPEMNTSEGQKQIDKAEQNFNEFEKKCEELTLDRMNEAPKLEREPQAKIAQRDLEKMPDRYLKPTNFISSSEKFNEKYRSDYNYAKEYVQFIAEHNEQSNLIEIWTKPFAGMPAEFWKVPTNTPVWGPRYLAEQITKCKYHRLKTEERITEASERGSFYGNMVVDTTINRLDARPASSGRKSIFMGVN